MLKHLVFFRIAPGAGDKAAVAAEVKRRLDALPPLIQEVRDWEVGIDLSGTGSSFDLALYTSFDDREALERYRVHPEHQKVVAYIQSVTSERAVVDYLT